MEKKSMLVKFEITGNEVLEAIYEAQRLLREAESVLYKAGITVTVEKDETASGN